MSRYMCVRVAAVNFGLHAERVASTAVPLAAMQQARRAVKAKNRAQADLNALKVQSEQRAASLATRLDGQLLLEDIVFTCQLMADNHRTDFFRWCAMRRASAQPERAGS